jgi:hypothetical protein
MRLGPAEQVLLPGKVPLQLCLPLASQSLPPLAELPLELEFVGEEHLSPTQDPGQGPHVRSDGVTG